MTKDKIVIIGNGFDLAHGYETSFKNFAENNKGKYFKRYVRDLYGNKVAKNNEKWTDFERIIQNSTLDIFRSDDQIDRLYKKAKCREWNEFPNKIDNYFSRLSDEIMDYLDMAQKQCEFKVKNSVKRYLSDNSYIISFNYTDIAEKYTNNIFHIHGSINERDIILGYDHHNFDGNGESCVMEPNLMKRNKRFMRQTLNYKRYLRSRNLPRYEIDKLGKKYLEYIVNCEGNMSGINKTAFKGCYYNDFIKSPNYDRQLPIDIKFDKIKSLVIIGHSLLSDQKLIKESIINKCCNLKRFIIFAYDKEPFKEIYKKAVFLHRLCPRARIIIKKY